ncbi:hypothetical protein KIPE111705_20195 [Kibdelosporangium persicum]|uniref:Secreted protein with PEP-CTERM sorting signal n=1 Tax=Kibdelosporangium persicum TaxID=2698649 RepID=A0ABX2FH93_9PSEU|nr:hypothetical protein [Kibdelosporangium persicum]NRN70123.1 putative secreted protein with PEP-CTERM sorting signal [Kibdelosporangium persicum]
MLMLVLTWIGAVLGVALVLLMALGPVIVELDSMVAQRRRERRRQVANEQAAANVAAHPVFH